MGKKRSRRSSPTTAEVAHILPALRPHAVRISTLNLDPENALDHEERDLDATGKSLDAFQQHRVAVVQKAGRRIRVGNGMVEALRAQGHEWVAAIIVDEDDLKTSARAIADNKTGRLAPWNDNLAKTLARLGAEAPELAEATGFTEKEIATIVGGLGPEDPGPNVPGEAPEGRLVEIRCSEARFEEVLAAVEPLHALSGVVVGVS